MWFAIGTVVSLVAAIIIEVFLALVLFSDPSIICSQIGVAGGFPLVPLAFLALYSYARGTHHARPYMVTVAPLGVLLGLLAFPVVAVGYPCPMGPFRVFSSSLCYGDYCGLSSENGFPGLLQDSIPGLPTRHSNVHCWASTIKCPG